MSVTIPNAVIELDPQQQKELVENLINTLEKYYVSEVKKVETHISTIFLVADKAFKLKKPLDFGFLNFTSLKQREFYCREELRLNQRLAPQIYQQVVPVYGTIEKPVIIPEPQRDEDHPLTPIDYLVEMQRFEAGCLFDELLSRNKLEKQHIESLATEIAEFHFRIINPHNDTPDGHTPIKALLNEASKNSIAASHQNFDQLAPIIKNSMPTYEDAIVQLEDWTNKQITKLHQAMHERAKQGFVRECHGDIHLGNITLHQGKVTVFDCIEFNQAFRWVDVISEIAFSVMDLDVKHRHDYANLLLNHYLEQTGDYKGLRFLHFYLVYRAMVRAKIAAFRLQQLETEEAVATKKIITQYIRLAEQYTQNRKPRLIITHGLSGSGKSYQSGQLLEKHPYIRIRSDVERQRLFPNQTDRYSKNASLKTYQYLHETAALLLSWGFSVIIDATYLQSSDRARAANIAHQQHADFHILALENNIEVLEQRIRQRQHQHTDASEATIEVLHKQLESRESLSMHEQPFVSSVSELLQASQNDL